ncbi:hypothetical protein D3C84_688440 [compost metagenome]
MGKTASMMGTAPRRPTQEMNQRSRGAKFLNGSSPIHTDTGRANRIIHMASASAGTAMGSSLWGEASSPSTRNMPIWLSQVRPSSTDKVVLRLRRERLPSNRPVR